MVYVVLGESGYCWLDNKKHPALSYHLDTHFSMSSWTLSKKCRSLEQGSINHCTRICTYVKNWYSYKKNFFFSSFSFSIWYLLCFDQNKQKSNLDKVRVNHWQCQLSVLSYFISTGCRNRHLGGVHGKLYSYNFKKLSDITQNLRKILGRISV